LRQITGSAPGKFGINELIKTFLANHD